MSLSWRAFAATALLATATLAGAPVRAEAALVEVEVSPSHIVLGADEGADVTVFVAAGEVSGVEVYTNVGSVVDVKRAGERVYRARLVPPAEFYPHVAVVVAVAVVAGVRHAAFTTLPLWGQGALEASGAPGEGLVASIGTRRYGPAKAGEDGLARIPIQVAPGETEAIAAGETLPLGLVDFPRVVGVFLDNELRAHPDLDVTGEVRFFVTDPSGAAATGEALELDVVKGKGSMEVPVLLMPGVVAARVRVPAGTPPGPLELRWRLKGSKASRGSVTVDVVSAPPVPAELEGYGESGDGAVTDLKLDTPASLVLGRDATAPVVVTLPPGAAAKDLRLYSNVGRVTSLQPAGEGRFLATFHAPGELHPQIALIAAVADVDGVPHVGLARLPLHGQQHVRVRGKARGKVTVEVDGQRFGPVKADRRGYAKVPVVVPPGVSFGTSGIKRVPLKNPAFPRLLIVPLAAHGYSDGGAELGVRLYAMRPEGTPATDAAVRLDVDKGSLSPAQPAGKGTFSARFRAPSEVGLVRFVAALDGDANSTATLQLPIVERPSAVVAAASPPRETEAAVDDTPGVVVSGSASPASDANKLLLLGAHAGFASNLIAMYAPLAAVDVTLQGSGFLDGGMLQLELGSLYQPGESRVSSGPLEGNTYARHLVAVPVVVTGGWRVRFADLSLSAGAGAKAEWVYSVVGAADEQFLSFGPVAHLAGAYHVGPGEIVVKARYSYGGLEGGLGAGTLLCGYAVEVF